MQRVGMTIALCTVLLYVSAIAAGLHLGRSSFGEPAQEHADMLALSRTDLVAEGERIFNHTPDYAGAYVGGRLSCSSCHAEGGRQILASPMTGVVQRFPQFSKRSGRVISLQDRIRQCFVRSENGRPMADDAEPMRALMAYLQWMSPRRDDHGRGLEPLAMREADPVHGAQVYAAQCAGCHGANGQGQGQQWPALWGPDSYNDGAGMNRVNTFAAFVHHNMPQNRMGILSVQDAFDVSAFVHAQPRPKMNPANERY